MTSEQRPTALEIQKNISQQLVVLKLRPSRKTEGLRKTFLNLLETAAIRVRYLYSTQKNNVNYRSVERAAIVNLNTLAQCINRMSNGPVTVSMSIGDNGYVTVKAT